MKTFRERIWQSMLEWHCILEHHIWYKTKNNKIKCARCRKIRKNG